MTSNSDHERDSQFAFIRHLLLIAAAIAAIGFWMSLTDQKTPPPADSPPPLSQANQAGDTPSGKPTSQFEDAIRMISAADLRPVVDAGPGYATSDTCLDCHESEHQSWHHSFHRTMTQVIDADTAPEVIHENAVTVNGQTFRFQREENRFFVTFADPLVGGEIRRRELVMMTGSHHLHVFWYETEKHGTPGQLDIVYLVAQERWIPRASSFLQPPQRPEYLELGTWNRTCSRCHSTNPREGYREHQQDWDTRVAEFGIACEACHGEGKSHVEYHREKKLAGDAEPTPASLIVNPGTLSKQASADACGQCHSIFLPDYDVVSQEDYMRDGNPFRPGDLLSDLAFSKVVRATPEHHDSVAFERWSQMESASGSFWSDGMVRIAGREYNGLIESACFVSGEMTCVSCHEMHPSDDRDLDSWRSDQLKPDMHGDQACLQCHPSYQDNITEHTHHAADSHGSRCMNCHMPHTTYGLLKTIRSHQISSPTIQASRTTDRINACNLCHLDQGFQWSSQYLHEWYGQPLDHPDSPKNDDDSSTEQVATSVQYLLSGDAAQRAVVVAAMGWQPAQEVSGTDWMEPLLWLALNDPYDAVRLVGEKSLAELPGRITQPIDALAPASERMQAFNQAIEQLDQELRSDANPLVLMNEEGRFDFPRARAYLQQRNHRPIWLHE